MGARFGFKIAGDCPVNGSAQETTDNGQRQMNDGRQVKTVTDDHRYPSRDPQLSLSPDVKKATLKPVKREMTDSVLSIKKEIQ